MWATQYGDYDHLARVKEWSAPAGWKTTTGAANENAADIPDIVRSGKPTYPDPNVSAWVAANAGSGKTHVLAQRVINLLLEGVEPEKILCITFTKAAAANMAERVFDTLGAWTKLDDAALDAKPSRGSGIATPTPKRARWRGGCSPARWKRRAA
jgi:hypothetical protein